MEAEDNQHDGGGMRFGEVLLISLIAAAIGAMFLPGFFHSRNVPYTRTDSIAATLQRIETAKHQYTADHRKKPGDPVTMRTLVREGYLAAEPIPPPGGAYLVGAVGAPVDYVDSNGNKEDR